MIPLSLSKYLTLPELPLVVPVPACEVPTEATAPDVPPVKVISPVACSSEVAYCSPLNHNLLLLASQYCTTALCALGVTEVFVQVTGSPT